MVPWIALPEKIYLFENVSKSSSKQSVHFHLLPQLLEVEQVELLIRWVVFNEPEFPLTRLCNMKLSSVGWQTSDKFLSFILTIWNPLSFPQTIRGTISQLGNQLRPLQAVEMASLRRVVRHKVKGRPKLTNKLHKMCKKLSRPSVLLTTRSMIVSKPLVAAISTSGQQLHKCAKFWTTTICRLHCVVRVADLMMKTKVPVVSVCIEKMNAYVHELLMCRFETRGRRFVYNSMISSVGITMKYKRNYRYDIDSTV
jgi:hypothetical protein